MTSADLDQVLSIERMSFAFPWSTRFFLQELQAECARSILAEIEGCIVGYVLFWILPEHIDVHNVAVHGSFGTKMPTLGMGCVLLAVAVAAAWISGRLWHRTRRNRDPEFVRQWRPGFEARCAQLREEIRQEARR
jgi:hypothetical protein